MNILCNLNIHSWIFGYRYGWVVAKKCVRCDKTHFFYEDVTDNIMFYDNRFFIPEYYEEDSDK